MFKTNAVFFCLACLVACQDEKCRTADGFEHCYRKFQSSDVRIRTAADECQTHNGEIVSITTEQEFNFVISHMEQCMYKVHKNVN